MSHTGIEFEEQVTPEAEHGPNRTYIRKDATISCYPVHRDPEREWDIDATNGPKWVLTLPTRQDAILLMHDLYYGEYTGG